MKTTKLITAFALFTACNSETRQDPAETVEHVEAGADATECAGGECDDVDGSAEFCTSDWICHSHTRGFRLPTQMPNGSLSCPPQFDLIQLDAPHTSRTDACDAASALAWPLECEVGCIGDVDLDPPVAGVIMNGCCSFDYHRDCEKAPACAEQEPRGE